MSRWQCWFCSNERPGMGDKFLTLRFDYPFGEGPQVFGAHPLCIEQGLAAFVQARSSEQNCLLCDLDAAPFDNLELDVLPDDSPLAKLSGRVHARCINALDITYPIDIEPGATVDERPS